MVCGHVDAAHRFFHRRYPSSFPSTAAINEFVFLTVIIMTLANSMLLVWPANLVNCALFNTLHQQVYSGIGSRGGISRERFFFYAFLGSTCWYFFPGYIFQALSVFSWVCWIAPNNVVSLSFTPK